MYLFTIKWICCCVFDPVNISQWNNLNTWLKTCTQILIPTPVNVHRGTHTSLHLFVFYAGFQSLLQYHSSMSSVRYNEAVLYKDLVRAWSPIFMYKDHWQVSIVYLNFLVTMWIHLKSRSPNRFYNWRDVGVVR